MRVACLERGTFSFQLVSQEFPNDTPVECHSFSKLIETALSDQCDFAVAPLENNNSGKVMEFQNALLQCKGKLFVADLYQHEIEHHLFSRADLSHISEVRSFGPAVKQCSQWLTFNLPSARRVSASFNSTVDAVSSLISIPPILGVAAIGCEDAGTFNFPTIARNIQNNPNYTTFCRIDRNRPSVNGADRCILAVSEYSPSNDKFIDGIFADCGITHSSTWPAGEQNCLRLFELYSLNDRLKEVQIQYVERRLKNCFFVGSYTGKTLTSISSFPPIKRKT